MRRGRASILEQKMVLKVAVTNRVHAVVIEMMSFHPESLKTEAFRILKPHILVVTNIRPDHLDAIGNTKEDIACCFASAIPRKSTVFIPEEEFYPVFRQRAGRSGSRIILVPQNGLEYVARPPKEIPVHGFEQNIRLAMAVADFLGIDRDRAYGALVGAHPDFGGLKVWKLGKESSMQEWYFVSAFSANDPESTRRVLEKLEGRGLFKGKKKRIGLLNLRQDRGDRTIQWFHALQKREDFLFDRLVIMGEHALVLRNRLKNRLNTPVTVLRIKEPEELNARLFDLEEQEAVVIGIGNMGGMGQRLVDYWERIGINHDL